MALRILTESATEPISVAEAGWNLRAADDGESPPTYIEADTIGRLIKVAREACEEEAELSILEREYELSYDYFYNDVELPKPPVRSITSVKYLDTNGVEQTLSSTVYTLDNRDALKPAILRLAYDQSWPDARRDTGAIKVRYVAGFRLSESPPDVVPESLRQAMHLLISHYFSNREAVSTDQLAEMPMGVKYLIGKYRVQLGV